MLLRSSPNDSSPPSAFEKGKPFAPDERMNAILKEAAAVGDATARTLAYFGQRLVHLSASTAQSRRFSTGPARSILRRSSDQDEELRLIET